MGPKPRVLLGKMAYERCLRSNRDDGVKEKLDPQVIGTVSFIIVFFFF